MPVFNLDGTPVDQPPAVPSVPVPTPPASDVGLPTSPSSPRFDLDGTANGASVNATRIGLSIESEKATPETAVRVLKMEKATRLPLPVIQENLEDVERQVEKKNFDPDRFARENPKAAAWLAAHPQHAALAKDDYNNLSLLETIISKLSGSFIDPSISVAKGLGRGTGGVIKTTGRSLWSMGLPESTENVESISSMIDVAGGPSSGEDSFQEAYADIQKRTGISPGSVSGRELVTKMEPLPYKFFREEGLGPLGKWLTGKGKKIEESALLKDTYHQTTSITQRLMERPVETLLVEGSQQAPNLVASIGGALATKKVGMSPAVGAFATSYLMEKGDILDEGMSYLIELHGSEEKIPPEQIARLNEIATNHASFNAVLDSLAPSSMVARSVIAKAGIKRLLSKQGVKFVAKEAMKDLAREMSTEVVQEESTMRALEKTTGKEIPFEQRLERYITVMAGTLLPVSGSSAVSSRSQISQANKELAVDAERAKQTGQVFTTLGEVATESKTRERLPEKFEEMIGQMTKDGPVENLYVPVEFYQTHWSEQGLDPRAVSAEMGIAKQYDEAITTGGRMEIPTAVYARRIAATEHNAVFAKELSTAPDVMNAREAEEFLKTAGEEIQEKPDAAFEESLSKVREDIRGQMIGLYPQDVVDKYIALEIDSKFATRAKRLGVDPLELYNRRPWTVSRQLPAVLKKLGKVTNLDALIDRVKAGDVQANNVPRETIAAAESLERHFSGLGIDIKTLSNEEVKRILSTGDMPAGEYTEEYGQAQTPQPGLPADEDLHRSVTGKPRSGWVGATGIRGDDGQVFAVYRGAELRLQADHFLPENLGYASEHPSAGLGVFFTSWESEAPRFGPTVEAFFLDIRNPKVYDGGTFPGFESVEAATVFREKLRDQGYDGVVMDTRDDRGPIHAVAFDPEQVVYPDQAAGLEVTELTPEEIAALEAQGITFYQSEQPFSRKTEEEIRNSLVKRRIKGDMLEDAIDLANDLQEKGGVITPEGTAILYHRTNKESAEKIVREQAMHGKEDGLFFGTSPTGQIEGYGDAVVQIEIPLEKISLNDVFANEAHVWMKTGTIGKKIPVRAKAVVQGQPLFQSDVKKQADTPEFKKWFGDSKVVDENGGPLVVFHGGKGTISKFGGKFVAGVSTNAESASHGYFFTSSTIVANTYARGAPDADLLIAADRLVRAPTEAQQKYDISKRAGVAQQWIEEAQSRKGTFENAKIYPVYLSIKNPMIVTDMGSWKERPFMSAILKAKKEGHDGIVFKNIQDAWGTPDRSDVFVAFDPEQIKSAIGNRGTFDPNDPNILKQGKDIKRGLIRLGKDRINIELLQNANLSTFLHELSHKWLDELIDDATSPNAPQQLKDDLDRALAYLKVDVRTEHGADAIRKAVTEEHHETWARSGEAYLMEGKAPSRELRSLMATFRAWLVSIYKSLTSLNVELTPEVRGVFDRLLATDEQIEAARNEAVVQPIFTSAAEAGMTDPQFAAYQETVEDASRAAQEELEQKLIQDFTRERKKWWKDERAKVKTEVTAEVDEQRVYKAIAALQSEGGIRLDRKAVANAYGKDFLKRLPRGVAVIEGGAHADTVAELVGYGSGQELLTDMANARPRNALIEAEADRRMHEEHGDLLTDGGLYDEARRAVQNELRGKVIEAEIRALNRKAREVKPFVQAERKAGQEAARAGQQIYQALVPNLAVVRDQAARIIAAKQVREVRPMAYFAAARKASRAAIDAMRKKDYLMAGHQKGMELLNLELYREANRVKDDIESSIDKLKKAFAPDAKVAKSRNVDMVNAARAILAFHGIGRADKAPMAYLDAMRRYDPEMYENMRDQVESVSEKQIDYREMTVEEFIGMRDSVLALMHTSRRSKQMMVDGKLIERQEAENNLINRIGELTKSGKKAITTVYGERSFYDLVKDAKLTSKAWVRRVNSWVTAMDGGAHGPFRTYILNPVIEQIYKYRDKKADFVRRYLEIIRDVETTLDITKIDASLLKEGAVFNGMNALQHAIMHTGNDSNRTKLLVGYGWGELREDGTLDTTRWDSFEEKMQDNGVLTKAHYDFAQKVWNLMEEMKPELQRAHKAMYGYYFEEVTARPFTNRFGEYRGGYIPAKIDPTKTRDIGAKVDAEEFLNNQNTYALPSTGKGSTISRNPNYNRPLILDMRSIPVHIDWAMRFTYIQPAVTDVYRLIKSKEFNNAMDGIDPAAVKEMLVPWLQRSATQQVSTRGAFKYADMVARYLRNNSGAQMMVLNIPNVLQQLTGFAPAKLRLGRGNMRTAAWEFTANHKELVEFINKNSAMMRNRVFTAHNDMMQTIDDILLNPSKYEKGRDFLNKHGYFLQQATQSVVDLIVWKAAFNMEMEISGDFKEAVRYADATVIETQGSFAPEDIARFEAQSPVIRLLTMFSGWFNMTANLMGTEFSLIATNQLGLKKGAGRAFFVYFMAMAIPMFVGDALLRAVLGGFPPDDDDDGYMDELLAMYFGSQIRGGASMIPFVGQLAVTTTAYLRGKPLEANITVSPVITTLEKAARAPYSIYKAVMDDGSQKRAVQDTLVLIGVLTGTPAGALSRPLGYLADVHQGKAHPENVIDLTRGLISGRDPNRSK